MWKQITPMPITSVNSNDSTAGNFSPWDLDGVQP